MKEIGIKKKNQDKKGSQIFLEFYTENSKGHVQELQANDDTSIV